ncbi:MAG TPA: alpha/beta fold hydrolase [Candidatus Stackebrandtia excrementipullorum]|nr:alpha/beta fold hydrolase [Candidatus Stackebrandtia excrementipullorum]
MTTRRVKAFEHGLVVNPDAQGNTVIMLHHAGATAASLLALARGLPSHHRVVLVDRAGRGVRSREKRVETFEGVSNDLVNVVAPFTDRPTILFGHSMGAMLAHELAVELLSRGTPPSSVLLSGTHPTRSELTDLDLSASHVVADRLERLGGTPPEVLADPALLELAVEIFTDDLLILRTYTAPTPLPPGTGIRHHLWLGADDPTLSVLDDGLWRDRAGVAAEVTLFSGGHFFLFENPRVPDALAHFVSTETKPPEKRLATTPEPPKERRP